MRQLTRDFVRHRLFWFSKLPMRQLTGKEEYVDLDEISKLPMRQLTYPRHADIY